MSRWQPVAAGGSGWDPATAPLRSDHADAASNHGVKMRRSRGSEAARALTGPDPPTIVRHVPRPTDIRVTGATLWFLPVRTRVPLKFGTETLTSVTCARVRLRVADAHGVTAEGWGETPLSVQWVWPSPRPYAGRHETLKSFCIQLAQAWSHFGASGHPVELGHDFAEHVLPRLLACSDARSTADDDNGTDPSMPWLAALVCCSAFDLALHDAYGQLHGRPTYSTYTGEFLSRDLAEFIGPDAAGTSFAGKFPADFLVAGPPAKLLAWHLVGGADPLEASELDGSEPDDGHPVLLMDWIRCDGLRALKVKLRGTDATWDLARLVKVGTLALPAGVELLTADFNCTVTDPAYVCDILDQLAADHPQISARLRYVEQPFPYDLDRYPLDVRPVSGRKPLFLDESAHDWKKVRLGRSLGWTGVALKTCKTQTGALLAACWAKAHGMELMVQDLTNPMLAMLPHALLAAHVGTIAGVETNAMQFYPAASGPEAAVHPGLYRRRGGEVDLGSLGGPGFGYRLAEIVRELPVPAVSCGA